MGAPEFDPEKAYDRKMAPEFDPEKAYARTSGLPGQPGVNAIGNPGGPTDPAPDENPGIFNKAVSIGKGALHSVANAASYLKDNTTRPAVGGLISAVSGKPTFTTDEWKQAATPFSGQGFPSVNTMLSRAGVPEGAKLSDYIGGYFDKGKSEHWYQPEKGGKVDANVRGLVSELVDAGIDPLNVLSLGSAGAAKNIAEQGATRLAAKTLPQGVIGRTMDAVGAPIDAALDTATKPAQALTSTRIGRVLNKVASAPSDAVDWLGKKAYGSMLQPAENEGAKFGKSDIGETLYNLGVANPKNIASKAKEGANALINQRDQISAAAEANGATVPMSEALQPARDAITKLRAVKSPQAQELADKLEAELVGYHKIEQGTPGTPSVPYAPPRLEEIPSIGFLGEPTTSTVMHPAIPGKPGSPGIAPAPYTPSDATRLKTFIYNTSPANLWNETARTGVAGSAQKSLALGLKEGAEDAVTRASGADAGRLFSESNSEAGKLIATRRGLQTSQNQANRLATGAVVPTGTAKIMGILEGPMGVAKDMAGNAARYSTMPVGYGMRKAAEGRLTAPMIDAYFRQKLNDIGAQAPGSNNGQ